MFIESLKCLHNFHVSVSRRRRRRPISDKDGSGGDGLAVVGLKGIVSVVASIGQEKGTLGDPDAQRSVHEDLTGSTEDAADTIFRHFELHCKQTFVS